jgi:hypothetical protein
LAGESSSFNQKAFIMDFLLALSCLGEARDADRASLLAQFRRMTGIAALGGALIILISAVMQAL